MRQITRPLCYHNVHLLTSLARYSFRLLQNDPEQTLCPVSGRAMQRGTSKLRGKLCERNVMPRTLSPHYKRQYVLCKQQRENGIVDITATPVCQSSAIEPPATFLCQKQWVKADLPDTLEHRWKPCLALPSSENPTHLFTR